MTPVLLIIGVVLILWAMVDLVTGSCYLMPSIHRPGMRFTRDDDGPVFYVVVLIKLGGAGYLLLRGFE